MARGTFDNEIKQAMAPDGEDVSPSPRQPAKSAQSGAQPKPPAPTGGGRPQLGAPRPGVAVGIRLPHPGTDPVSHAASIAHAILQHGSSRGY
jgi:hypothetical protein